MYVYGESRLAAFLKTSHFCNQIVSFAVGEPAAVD